MIFIRKKFIILRAHFNPVTTPQKIRLESMRGFLFEYKELFVNYWQTRSRKICVNKKTLVHYYEGLRNDYTEKKPINKYELVVMAPFRCYTPPISESFN